MVEKHDSVYVWKVIYVQYVIFFSQERERGGGERVISISCFKILRFIHARKFLKFYGEERRARCATEKITLLESAFLKNLFKTRLVRNNYCRV